MRESPRNLDLPSPQVFSPWRRTIYDHSKALLPRCVDAAIQQGALCFIALQSARNERVFVYVSFRPMFTWLVWACICLASLNLVACSDGSSSSPSGQSKEITHFAFSAALNPSLEQDVVATIEADEISAHFPASADLTVLVPTVMHNGVAVSPQSEQAQDFSRPVTYTVTAEDEGTAVYTVRVTREAPQSSAKEISKFVIAGVTATIHGSEITATLPFGTDVGALVPTIAWTGDSISPESKAPRNFAQPVTYTVTAVDGSTRTYTVTIRVAESSEKHITAFSVAGVDASISGNAIAVTLPYATAVTALVPTIATTGASVSPSSGAPQNFTQPVTYTVTAADGSTQAYTVTVSVALNPAKDITAFSVAGVDASISGNAIAVTLPYGTAVTALVPTIATTGASVSPSSGAPQDFTQPVTYTVTAADGSTQAYTVTVSVALNPAKDITAFSVAGVDATVSGNAIAVTLPYATDVTTLVPTIATTGASVSPSSGAPQDFTQPVVYTVTAQDGSTQAYTVTVSVALNPAKDITAFSVAGVDATVSGNAISLVVPNSTNLTALSPTIVHTGASVSPSSGSSVDFSTPVVYTVTAQDSSTQSYTVSVARAPNSTPVLSGGPFTLTNLPVNGQTVGSLTVGDTDVGQTHNFVITSDSSGGAFAIASSTGVITIADAALAVTGVHTLAVTVTDNGIPPATGNLSVSINIPDPPFAVADGPLRAFTGATANFNLLSNDSLGTPAANVVSFGGDTLGGTVTRNPADGTQVVFAGGTLSLTAAGVLNVLATTPGSYSFSYRLSNGAISDATVSLEICHDMNVGSIFVARPDEQPSACIGSRTASGEAEYVFVPMNLSESGAYSLRAVVSNTAALSGSAPTAGSLATGDDHSSYRVAQQQAVSARLGTTGAGTPVSPASGIPRRVPVVDEKWSLNVDVTEACSTGTAAAATVRAVGTHSIVVSDDSVPAGGFTAAQYAMFSWNFDNIIYPALTAAFGEPTDIDENGRVVLFITPALNRLSPPASSVVVSARHSPRDNATQAECPTSNAGELIYILAPDPTGSIHSNVQTVSFVGGLSTAEVAHEFAHLILDSRRVEVEAPFETAWLQEALSGLGEELAFYTASYTGVASISVGGGVSTPSTQGSMSLSQFNNIALTNLTSGPDASRRVAAFNSFANANYGRYRTWLQAPSRAGVTDSALGGTTLQRGASYAFLRYVTDRFSGSSLAAANAFLSELVDANLTGLDNLAARIDDDPTLWLRDYLLAAHIDDSGIANLDVSTLPYRTTTWNYRSVFGGLGGWPMVSPVFTADTPVTFNLAPGGSSHYVRFATSGSTPAVLTLTPPSGSDWDAWYAVFRTK